MAKAGQDRTLAFDVESNGTGKAHACYANTMSRPEEYFLVFANSDYTLDLSRVIRTETTDGWHFFQGKENIGTMLNIKTGGMHDVHASLRRDPDDQKITRYLQAVQS